MLHSNLSKNIMAAIQMRSSEVVKDNLLQAEKLIKEAAERGAKLIVLPEMFAIMGMDQSAKIRICEKVGEGPIQEFLANTATKYSVWIVGGTIPLVSHHPEKIRATCFVYNDKGIAVARYDKIHLFDVKVSETESYKESATVEHGDKVVLVETPFGKLGLAVCYDIRFPELFSQLRKKGAEIITVPSAFTFPTGKAHWEILLRTRALDTLCYTIGACQGGVHNSGRKTYGHSMIVNPWGEVMANFKEENALDPGILYATIDLDAQKTIRASLPVFEHQRL